jgi:hypothetical protein
VLGAEIEHLLRFGDAADHRTRVGPPPGDEREHVETERLCGGANLDQRAVHREQAQVRVDVDVRADRVDDQVEAAREVLERVRGAGRKIVISTQAQSVVLLLQRL